MRLNLMNDCAGCGKNHENYSKTNDFLSFFDFSPDSGISWAAATAEVKVDLGGSTAEVN